MEFAADKNTEAAELAGQLEAALQVDRGNTFRDVWHLLADKSTQTIESAEQLLPKLDNPEPSSYKENFNRKLQDSLSTEEAARIARMIAEKSQIEIPTAKRRNAAELAKAGTKALIGKEQTFTLPDGRSFDLFIPSIVRIFKENGQTKVPTIVACHGVLRAAVEPERSMPETTGLNLLAEREGFVAIYPHPSMLISVPPTLGWSIPDRENILPANPDIDDVKEVEKMISYVREQIMPISSKVGLIGHSDGGRFAQGFAIERPEQVAYLVPWSSTWMKNDSLPGKGIPTRIILNDKDETLPMRGGEGRNSKLGDLLLRTHVKDSRPQMMREVWAKANHASGIVEKTTGKVTSQTYRHARQSLRVDIIHGSSHAIADWHNIGGGTTWSPADTTLNMSYDVIKEMMPYLVNTGKR